MTHRFRIFKRERIISQLSGKSLYESLKGRTTGPVKDNTDSVLVVEDDEDSCTWVYPDDTYESFSGPDIVIPTKTRHIDDFLFCGSEWIGSVSIHDGIDEIGYCAFADCTGLESVSIGKGVSKIGIGAFTNCIRLKTLDIPRNVAEIGDFAFRECASLESMFLGSSVRKIGMCAFQWCGNLKQAAGLDNVAEIDLNAFRGTPFFEDMEDGGIIMGKALYCYKGTCPERYEIPNTVKSITTYAFKDQTSVITVVIPESVVKIGHEVFQGCVNLENALIPNGVQDIGTGVFGKCQKLSKNTLESYIKSGGRRR